MGTMVRASGGFSRQNMADEKEAGRLEGIAEAKQGNAQRSQVLARDNNNNPITFTNSDIINAEGAMPNNGNYNIQLQTRNQTSTIPVGYHAGNGTVSVKTPTARKTLTANQTGVTSLSPYDYADVDASAVFSAGKAAVMNSGTFAVNYQNVVEASTGESIQSAFTNNTSYAMDVVICATASRPRGNGYSHPNISATGATKVEEKKNELSSEARQTNVAIISTTYKVAAGATISFTITITDNAGVVSYMVLSKRA